MTRAMPAVVVFSTFPNEDVAATIARALVDEQLAACVNLVPAVRSIYRWQGKTEDAGEVLAVIKTTAARLPALRARLVALHPYDVPEVIALRAAGGHAPYLAWIEASAKARGRGRSRSR